MGLLGEIADFGKGVIENNAKWTERAVKAGEFIVRNTVGAQLEQVAKLGSQVIELGHKAADLLETRVGTLLVRAARSPILAAGQQTIETMKKSTGVGAPENGGRFGDAAAKLSAAGQVLASAGPNESWNSGGASAYTARNTEQVGRVQRMIELDNTVAGVLTKEAGEIAAARAKLDGHSDWLGSMSLLTTSAGIIPGFGPAARMGAEIAMVAKAVGESNDDLNTLRGQINENAAVLQTAAAQYQTLAAGAAPTGAEFEPPLGSAPDDPASSAPGVPSGGGGAPSGGGGGMPSGSGGGSAGGAPSSAPSMSSIPSTSGAGAPASDAAGDAAGAMGTLLGSMMSPLSGMLSGVTQAAGQAAQAATQAASQAAQMAGQAAGPAMAGGTEAAQLDKASGDLAAGPTDVDGDGRPDEDEDRDGEEDKDDEDEKDDKDDEDGIEDENEESADGADEDRADGLPPAVSLDGPADPMDAEPDREAAKTLPPDLEAMAAGGGAAGPAPVHVGADFEQGPLHVAAAATLDRGVPGSAAVIER
ncbi:hypothetical protein A5733_00990 [Mycobacterium sp. NS-7484]|uniref:EspA/EspE family type VII secretion system effector n=1 Tax=Mycobacterium sp. NS-7484 TaxID=1834161 RepID=UPI00096FDA36|nr:EspA/EspE family type VII secretion system effector [Mycobacterium sp. NS-7484]OMB99278.1 hypothetical protein A5733_00990 [Mycobacterium sp. NS-7484]